MNAPLAAIPAPTEQQALDWSLVLASQGIDAAIEREPDSGACRLLVSAPDLARAAEAIRLYRAENLRRRWQQEFPGTGLLFDWRAAAWLLLLALFFLVSERGPRELRTAGMMDNQAVLAGEWWRLFTAMMLHADIGHLVLNVTTGLLLLGLAMGAFGPGIAVLGAWLAGAGGYAAGLCIYPEGHRSLGASGLVMGALGLLAAQSLSLLRRGLAPRQLAARAILGGCLLAILVGFSPAPGVDLVAHAGGFVTGLLLGAGLALAPFEPARATTANRIAEILVGLGVPGTWWLALR